MNKPADDQNMLDPMAGWRTMRDASMEAWSKAMIDMINTEAFSQSLGTYLDNYLAVSAPLRQSMQRTMTQVLADLNMPSRPDVGGLSERLTSIEMRLDDMEAKLDTLLRDVHRGALQSSQPLNPEER